MVIAKSYAFPMLAEDRAWKARINAAYEAVKPSDAKYQEIVARAGEISGSLQAQLGRL